MLPGCSLYSADSPAIAQRHWPYLWGRRASRIRPLKSRRQATDGTWVQGGPPALKPALGLWWLLHLPNPTFVTIPY